MRWNSSWFLLALLLVSPLRAQEWKVQVTSPLPNSLFGWAQNAPEIKLRGEFLRGDEKVVPREGEVVRLFMTGQVFAGGKLIDTVPMWDDGTHGDEKEGDGTYTALYRPPKSGEYRVRIRAQADIVSGGKVFTKEFWSEFVNFKVVPVPYARITQPETGSEIKGKITLRARLLVLEKPFDERDETLVASVKVEGEGWQKELPLNRRGSLLTAKINFPKRGTYRLVVSVAVKRDGETLRSESEIVEVYVAKLGYFWLVLGVISFLVFLLLPPKEPPLKYQHNLRLGHHAISVEPGETKEVGNLELEGAINEPKVKVRQKAEMPNLRQQNNPIPQRELDLREGEKCWVGDERLELAYERAKPKRETARFWYRFLPNTFWRLLFFALTLATIAYWWWQWKQFAG